MENLDVDVLSALSANLGTVTAGKIQNNNSAGYVVIDLATGEIKSYNDTDLATLLIKAGKFTMTGKDPNTILVELGISPEDGFSGTVSDKRVSIHPEPADIDGTSTTDFVLEPEGKSGIMMYQRLSNIPEKTYETVTVKKSLPTGRSYFDVGPITIPDGCECIGLSVIRITADWIQCSLTLKDNGMINVVAYNYFTSEITSNIEIKAIYAKG